MIRMWLAYPTASSNSRSFGRAIRISECANELGTDASGNAVPLASHEPHPHAQIRTPGIKNCGGLGYKVTGNLEQIKCIRFSKSNYFNG